MRLHTTTWGSGDRIALLVHGLMADHRTWRRVGPALSERGYRVVAVDLRGHGASGRARARRSTGRRTTPTISSKPSRQARSWPSGTRSAGWSWPSPWNG